MEEILLTLAVLVCPVAMGLMMLFMRKGRGQDEDARAPTGSSSLADLRAEQHRIAAEVARLQERERTDDRQAVGR